MRNTSHFIGDVSSNRSYYTNYPSTTPSHIKFRRRTKSAPKLFVWMVISPKIRSRVYVHRSKTAIGAKKYLNECILKRLIPFIDRYHADDSMLFWPDLASAHYAREMRDLLTAHGINFVPRGEKPAESITSMTN